MKTKKQILHDAGYKPVRGKPRVADNVVYLKQLPVEADVVEKLYRIAVDLDIHVNDVRRRAYKYYVRSVK